MGRENMDVRRAAFEANVPLCQIAMHLGVSEVTLLRWMRAPLPNEKRVRIMEAINNLREVC